MGVAAGKKVEEHLLGSRISMALVGKALKIDKQATSENRVWKRTVKQQKDTRGIEQ